MTRLEIESDIVEIGGSKRRTKYLKLPKNLVELFGLKLGSVQLDVSLRNGKDATLPNKDVVIVLREK